MSPIPFKTMKTMLYFLMMARFRNLCKLIEILFCKPLIYNEFVIFHVCQSLKEDKDFVKFDGDSGKLQFYSLQSVQKEQERVVRSL